MPQPSNEPPSGPVSDRKPVQPVPRFRQTALASGLVDAEQISACEESVGMDLGDVARVDPLTWDAAVAECLVRREALTRFQADQLLAGRRKLTLGQYRILDELGRGGMGQVFRAQHTMMGRTVAIKVLPRAKSTSESEAAFQREIRMLARLDHENLVRALDAGHDGKVYYLVTELVPGLDLRRQVLKHGRLDEARAASVITQAAVGLAYAHSQGLVHRDVKPANLLVTPEGHVKVLDLGLAGSVIEGESARLGRVVGTMDYMAPEQIRTPDTVGPSADIYALGCTLYFALTGEVPFPGGTRQEKAQRQLKEQPRPIRQLVPGVSEGLCRVVESIMRKNPLERPLSAADVVERLRPWAPPAPLEMPRSKQPPPLRSAHAGVAEDTTSRRSTPASLPGSSQWLDLLNIDNQSTRGLLSAAEETDRGSGPLPMAPPRPLVAGRLAATRRWAMVMARSVAVATVTAVVFMLVMRMVFGIDRPTADAVFGPRGLTWLGWVAFGLMLAAQLMAEAGRRAR
ncbi:MAG: serine/threonine-protein kinase [Planctomycetia bacterium]